MKNLIKYTIGLPLLILDSVIGLVVFIFEVVINFLEKGKTCCVLEWQVTKDILKETWEPIK